MNDTVVIIALMVEARTACSQSFDGMRCSSQQSLHMHIPSAAKLIPPYKNAPHTKGLIHWLASLNIVIEEPPLSYLKYFLSSTLGCLDPTLMSLVDMTPFNDVNVINIRALYAFDI